MSVDVEALFEQVRSLCLKHPEAFEKPSHGSPAFFLLKGGQFATLWNNHHDDGNIALLLAARPGIQEALISENADVYYRPPYYGPGGWVGVRLDKGLPLEEIEGLIDEAFELILAKKRAKSKSKPKPA